VSRTPQLAQSRWDIRVQGQISGSSAIPCSHVAHAHTQRECIDHVLKSGATPRLPSLFQDCENSSGTDRSAELYHSLGYPPESLHDIGALWIQCVVEIED
jgi:lysine/ornithine N-monooxygenase